MAVRRIEERDLEAVLAVQSECPEIAQWQRADYERALTDEMRGWVAERVAVPAAGPAAAGGAGGGAFLHEPRVVGFVVARLIVPEVEILNFAVASAARGRGAGGDLLDAALGWARSTGANRAILEVRAANAAALRLYHRRDFQVVGRRPRYYANPTDDALLLTAALK